MHALYRRFFGAGQRAIRWLDGSRHRPIITVGLVALLLAAPSIVNGKPFLFFDSAHYFDIGQSIISKVQEKILPTGPETQIDTVSADIAGAVVAEEAGSNDAGGGLAAIAGGRSPTYSLLTAALGSVFSLFGMVALQSLLAGWVLFRFLEMVLGSGRNGEKLLLAACLSLLSPLGFHAGFIMPDIFAGIYVLAALVLIFDHGIGRLETLSLTALLCLSATMHTTILVLGVTLVVLTLAMRFIAPTRQQVNVSSASWIVASMAFSLVFSSSYKAGVKMITGDEVTNAPYLMARVVADGPGSRLLDERCDELQFAACAFRNTDYVDHNDFLWGGFGANPNFSTSPPELREAVQEEEIEFVKAAILAYPGEQLAASTKNALTQLAKVGISETTVGAETMIRDPAFANSRVLLHEPGLAHCSDNAAKCKIISPSRQIWALAVRIMTTASMVILFIWAVRATYGLFRADTPLT
ncbi:MAG: hypothetical protein R3C04_11540 [Hyphomonas sp.]